MMAYWKRRLFQGLLMTVVPHWLTTLVLSLKCPQPTLVTDSLLDCLDDVILEGQEIGKNVLEIERKCREGDYEASVACVRDLFNVCSCHEEQSQALYTWARPSNIQLAFQTLCQHLDLYSNKSQCMQRQDAGIKDCQNQVEQNLTLALNKQLDQGHEMMHYVETYCKMQWGIRDCGVDPVTKACGSDIGQLISVVMTGLIPPICQHLKQQQQQQHRQHLTASGSSISVVYLILVGLLAFLCLLTLTTK